MIAKFEQQIRV